MPEGEGSYAAGVPIHSFEGRTGHPASSAGRATLASVSVYVALATGVLVALIVPLVTASRFVALRLSSRAEQERDELDDDLRARIELYVAH
jgi:hypothetical protein